MNHSEHSPLGLYTIGIAALFLAGFLLLVVFGAQSYRKTAEGQNENMDSRAILSYLATTAKAYDEADAVHIVEYETGPVLVFRDGTTGYALRVYQYEGKLLEEYAKESAPLSPEHAETIGETELFKVEVKSSSLIAVRTDAGRVLLRIRSKGGWGA